jgi:hypothetical protein
MIAEIMCGITTGLVRGMTWETTTEAISRINCGVISRVIPRATVGTFREAS